MEASVSTAVVSEAGSQGRSANSAGPPEGTENLGHVRLSHIPACYCSLSPQQTTCCPAFRFFAGTQTHREAIAEDVARYNRSGAHSREYAAESNGPSEDRLFWTYASDFDAALVRFAVRPGGSRFGLELLTQSKQFEAILRLHGFEGKPVVLRCCKLLEAAESSLDPSATMDLPWVLTNEGRKCLHVEISVDCPDDQHCGVRNLPVLLSLVSSLSTDRAYCSWVVGQAVYLNQLPVRDGVWLWFPLSDMELINDEFWEQLGYCQETTPVYPQHRPSSWTSLIDPVCLQKALNNFQVMECSSGAVPYDLRVLYRKVNEDASVCLRCQGRPLVWSSSGKIIALIGCHTDVSADNRDHLTKVSFIGKISHEIRTPLNAMCGAYEVLSEYMDSAPLNTREAWAMLSSATRQVREVVDDVLDFSALSAGRMQLRSGFVLLEEMLEEVVRLHSSNAAAKSISLSVAPIPEQLPSHVFLDRARMQQVISNVFSNALKFTPEGGSVRVVVSVLPNRISSSTAYYAIDIVDTGRGIPRALWTSIFEDFQQARTGDSCVGTGLGLAICSMLVGLHGGRIFVKDSIVGKGTTFRIQMQTPFQPELSLPKLSVSRPSMDNGAIRLGRILLVDDTATNIMVLKKQIQIIDPDAEILVADNGRDAITIAIENDINFIMMDIHMPILDGIEATKYILASKPNMAVIGQTANTDAEVDVLCRQVGMKAVLLKPTPRAKLAATLAMIMAETAP